MVLTKNVVTRILPLFFLTLFFAGNSFSQLVSKDVALLSGNEAKLFHVEEHRFKKSRNKFLAWATTGQELALQGKFDKSNEYLEWAYETLEDKEGLLCHKARFGFEYEMYMLLYLKALNYCSMGEQEEALIECNRMKEWLSRDGAHSTTLAFKDEPLPHLLLGIIYEAEGFYNDAYIAYSSAYQLYKESYVGFFSMSDVLELQNAILGTAYASGLTEEYERLKEEFDVADYVPENGRGRELIFICHMGVGPYQSNMSNLAEFQVNPSSWSAKLKDVRSGITYQFGTAFQINFWKHKDWWTSLPRGIYFTRVLLQPGSNKFELTWNDQSGHPRMESFEISGKSDNQIRIFSSFEPEEQAPW